VQQFLHINELNEAHRVSMISWDKFYRRIKNELSRNPKERSHVGEFIMSSTEEFDRITETSPTIDKDIVDLFKGTFEGRFTSTDTKTLFQEISKPDILDKLISVKKSVYKEEKKKDTSTIIEGFSNKFKLELGRSPTREELIDNLSQEDIDPEQVDLFLNKTQIEEV
jgi:hypothetical protein